MRGLAEEEAEHKARGLYHQKQSRRWRIVRQVSHCIWLLLVLWVVVLGFWNKDAAIQAGLRVIVAHVIYQVVWALTGRSPSILQTWHELLAQCYLKPSGNRIAATQLNHSGPLAIFLRNFIVDSAAPPAYDPNYIRVTAEADKFRHPIERTVAEYFEKKGVPIVGVENPLQRESPIKKYRILAGLDIPRVVIRGESWEPVVRQLLGYAYAVVLLLDDVTPGVATELDMLDKLQVSSRTLVIVGARFQGSNKGLTPEQRHSFSKFHHVVFEDTRRRSRLLYPMMRRDERILAEPIARELNKFLTRRFLKNPKSSASHL